jgi:predicted permease
MKLAGKFRFCLGRIFRKERFYADMTEEMQLHLDLRVEKNIAAGMKPKEARETALKGFGGVDQIKELVREQRGTIWFEQIIQDVRFGFRSLVRSPGFSLTILVTLVLGIGVASAVFDLSGESVLFRQPYPDAGRLFVIGVNNKQFGAKNLIRPGRYFRLYQERTNLFTEFAAVGQEFSNIVVDGEPRASVVLRASADFFKTLGINPSLGRTFLPEEHFAGADNVVIVSNLFWRQRLHGRADVLGQKITVDKRVCTVVGVLKVLQRFPEAFGGDVYRPMIPINEATADVFGGWLSIIGRLRPGVTPEEACAALDRISLTSMPSWAFEWLSTQKPMLMRVGDLNRPDIEWVSVGAAAVLYLIACTNAMNLVLVRNLRRRHELGIRMAIGGTRLQVLRLLAVEASALGMTSCCLVLVIAHQCFPAIFSLLNDTPDAYYASYVGGHYLWGVLGLGLLATCSIAFVSGFSFLGTGIESSLKVGGTATGDNLRLVGTRNVLVAFQAALAVILMVGTGLMIRTFENLHHVDLGYNPEGKVKVKIMFPDGIKPRLEEKVQLFDRLSQKLASLPGVKGVSPGQDALLLGFFGGAGRLQMPDGTYTPVSGSFVSSNFQRVAGLKMKSGTWFSGRQWDSDVVINEALAKIRFSGFDPVGFSIKLEVSGDHEFRIVGVVRDVRETVRSVAGPRIYYPSWMYPENMDTLLMSLYRNPPPIFDDMVRRAIYEVDPSLITSQVSSIDGLVDESLARERYAFKVLRGLTAIGFGLAMIGVFSVIAYTVDCRMREFGVRIAVGASPRHLQALVLRRGLAFTAIGSLVGMFAGFGLTRFMQSMLYETKPYDPTVYTVVGLTLIAASTMACWIPATRASRADVTRLLKTE